MEEVSLIPDPMLNTSHNYSSKEAWSLPYTAAESALIILAVLTIILSSVIGNALVVLAICTSQALRAPQNLFLVSLASADILVSTLIIPFSLANEVMGYWHFGSIWCSLYLALDILFCTSSIVHLCAISLDRYWSVTKAITYSLQRTRKRIKSMIATIWVLSAIISFPPLVTSTHRDWECLLNDDTWYVLASCTISFFAPCMIMILVYCRIYQVAKQKTSVVFAAKNSTAGHSHRSGSCWANSRHNTQLASSHNSNSNQPQGEQGDTDLEDSTCSNQQPRPPQVSGQRRPEECKGDRKRLFWVLSRRAGEQRREQSISLSKTRLAQIREKRFTFVLAVVIGGFIICWFPFFFTYSLDSVCRESCNVSKPLFNFFFWVGYCNSSLNPIIYTVFNRDFRKAFNRILCHPRQRTL
ncbi:alpha-2Db adrenergic receptor-like [Rhinatrema bivittatum]|uniref:alpha-2Db adrenergic receptor-like n=1 Tax=Rhinatrema bivittatum TaxID=194408 RepID=UPI00112C6E90|nr:alpha-2Db adrenergic receptor-like [Rhinatrema bivittatum]